MTKTNKHRGGILLGKLRGLMRTRWCGKSSHSLLSRGPQWGQRESSVWDTGLAAGPEEQCWGCSGAHRAICRWGCHGLRTSLTVGGSSFKVFFGLLTLLVLEGDERMEDERGLRELAPALLGCEGHWAERVSFPLVLLGLWHRRRTILLLTMMLFSLSVFQSHLPLFGSLALLSWARTTGWKSSVPRGLDLFLLPVPPSLIPQAQPCLI